MRVSLLLYFTLLSDQLFLVLGHFLICRHVS
jgi:hypothetical protein